MGKPLAQWGALLYARRLLRRDCGASSAGGHAYSATARSAADRDAAASPDADHRGDAHADARSTADADSQSASPDADHRPDTRSTANADHRPDADRRPNADRRPDYGTHGHATAGAYPIPGDDRNVRGLRRGYARSRAGSPPAHA